MNNYKYRIIYSKLVNQLIGGAQKSTPPTPANTPTSESVNTPERIKEGDDISHPTSGASDSPGARTSSSGGVNGTRTTVTAETSGLRRPSLKSVPIDDLKHIDFEDFYISNSFTGRFKMEINDCLNHVVGVIIANKKKERIEVRKELVIYESEITAITKSIGDQLNNSIDMFRRVVTGNQMRANESQPIDTDRIDRLRRILTYKDSLEAYFKEKLSALFK